MLKLMIAMLLAGGILSAAHAAERTEYGGWTGVTSKATGFFRVEQIGDRWWCFDPTGAAFYAVGTDHCNYNVHWCETLGYAPYARNVRKKFNDDESAWAKSSTDRLKQWGFNALGANNSPSTRGRGLTYMEFTALGSDYAGKDGLVEKVYWTGFPNVFNPAFAEYCEKKAREQCARLKDDPWLFGWFLDNELEWFGKGGADTGLADEAIKRPATHEGKKALVELLKTEYGTIEKLNAAWKTSFASWDDALASTEWEEASNEKVVADKLEFVSLCADRYFSITTAAIRRADPNHMIIGCRFAGNAPPIWDIAGKYCDIVSFNIYGQVDLETLVPVGLEETLADWYKQCKRPMMCTEWSFPALDAGLPSVHGAGMRVRTQADKAKCFEVYQKTFFALPFMVGSDYFMWVDEPAQGISKNFPEDSNYGLVDLNDDVWPVFTEAVARVNPMAYDIHTGRTAEVVLQTVEADGRQLSFRVKNTGKLDAETSLVVDVDGKKYSKALSLPSGRSDTVAVDAGLTPGAHYVQAQVDPDGKLVEVRRGDNKLSHFIHIAGKPPVEAKIAIGVHAPVAGTYPITVPLAKVLGDMKIPDKSSMLIGDSHGETVRAEVHDLDGSGTITPDDEVLLEAVLSGEQTATYYMRLTTLAAGASLIAPSGGPFGSFTADTTALKITQRSDRPSAIDSIELGDLEIGSLDALMQQEAGGTWWVKPNTFSGLRVWNGVVCNRVEVTLENKVAAGSPSGPFGYRATYAFRFYPKKQWFTAQFLSVTNTDTRPWTLGAYFYYLESAIGGSSDGDEADPRGISGTAAWTDKQVGASYGIVAKPSSGVEVLFWKDEGGQEHSDARVNVEKLLQPGETYDQPGAPVHIFCARSKDSPQPWLAMEEEIVNLPRWEVFQVGSVE